MSKKNRFGFIAWFKDIKHMRTQDYYSNYERRYAISPGTRPLDKAYYAGWYDGWTDRGNKVEQLKLFDMVTGEARHD